MRIMLPARYDISVKAIEFLDTLPMLFDSARGADANARDTL